MNAQDIIRTDFEKRGLDPLPRMQSIAYLLKKKKMQMMQQNDSVLLLKDIGDGNVELHLFTQDRPLTLAKSLKSFIDAIRKTKIKAVFGQADNPEIVTFLRSLGVNVETKNLPEPYNWKATV